LALIVLTSLGGALSARASDTYDPATRLLTVPRLSIGVASYANVVLQVGVIVTPPTGQKAVGIEDTYDPATGHLSVPAVSINGQTYYNAIVTVDHLVSVASVTGADTFSFGQLSIPLLRVGTQVYTNVVLNVSLNNVVRVGGGLPGLVEDQYDPATCALTVAAVSRAAGLASTVYTNAVLQVTPKNIVSIGSSGPDTYANSTYSGQTNFKDSTVPIMVQTTTGGRLTATVNGSPGLQGYYAAATGDFTATGTYQGKTAVLTGTLNPPTIPSAGGPIPNPNPGGAFSLDVDGIIGTGIFGSLAVNTSYFSNVSGKVQGNIPYGGQGWGFVSGALVVSNPAPPPFVTGSLVMALEEPPAYAPEIQISGAGISLGQSILPIAMPTSEYFNFSLRGVGSGNLYDYIPKGQVIVYYRPDSAHTYYATAGTLIVTTADPVADKLVLHMFGVFFQGLGDLDPQDAPAGNQGSFNMDLTAIGGFSSN
jgi:hypothetical protein